MSQRCEVPLLGNHSGQIIGVPPYSEFFAEGRAGAFSLFIEETSRHSRFREQIHVMGQPADNPFPTVCFTGVPAKGPFYLSRNRKFAAAIAGRLKSDRPALIEVFNRPEVFLTLSARLPGTPIALHIANDPLAMKRGRARGVRARILERASAVFVWSDFLKRRFLDGLGAAADHVHVLLNGAVRLPERPAKEPIIFFAGRMIEEKGVKELASAIAQILPRFPQWRAGFAGANRPGGTSQPTPYEAEIHRILAPLGERVTFHGFVPAAEVGRLMRAAAIVVVPSKWEEPLGRTAIEGLAAGAAVIASNRGGLPETVSGRGLVLEEISPASLAKTLAQLISEPSALKALQDRAWTDFPFEMGAFVERYDRLRAQAMIHRAVGQV